MHAGRQSDSEPLGAELQAHPNATEAETVSASVDPLAEQLVAARKLERREELERATELHLNEPRIEIGAVDGELRFHRARPRRYLESVALRFVFVEVHAAVMLGRTRTEERIHQDGQDAFPKVGIVVGVVRFALRTVAYVLVFIFCAVPTVNLAAYVVEDPLGRCIGRRQEPGKDECGSRDS